MSQPVRECPACELVTHRNRCMLNVNIFVTAKAGLLYLGMMMFMVCMLLHYSGQLVVSIHQLHAVSQALAAILCCAVYSTV